MRLLLPLVCGVIAATALVLPLRAEGDTIVAETVVLRRAIQNNDRTGSAPAVPSPAAVMNEAVVPGSTPDMPAPELAYGIPRDRSKAHSLRDPVLMLLLPNLCCR